MPTIKVQLTGGPSYVTESMRSHEVMSLDESIKVLYGNGYEHFAYSGETTANGGGPVALFAWIRRTKIAE
jgi:hypothetical protein